VEGRERDKRISDTGGKNEIKELVVEGVRERKVKIKEYFFKGSRK
jgi:hypothetical protein